MFYVHAIFRHIVSLFFCDQCLTFLLSFDGLYQVKTPRKQRSLGILDMYGFQNCSEAPGGFEHLIMNFAYEKLLQVITEWTLRAEQEEYATEAVEWTYIDFPSNSEVVTLMERGSFGLLSLLDEVCINHHHMLYSGNGSGINGSGSGGGGGGSGSSTPSLAMSADEAFVERVAERFNQSQLIMVNQNRPLSSSAATSSTSGQEEAGDKENIENEDNGRASRIQPPPSTTTTTELGRNSDLYNSFRSVTTTICVSCCLSVFPKSFDFASTARLMLL